MPVFNTKYFSGVFKTLSLNFLSRGLDRDDLVSEKNRIKRRKRVTRIIDFIFKEIKI